MSIKPAIIRALVGLYPASWRAEYGAELADTLNSGPLGVAVVADVVGSACRQRVRTIEPATVLGVMVMLVIAVEVAWNVVAPQTYGSAWTRVLQPSLKLLPVIAVTPLSSDYFVLLVVGAGFLLAVGGRTQYQAAWAAAKICAIAGIPIVVAGILIQVGVLDLIVLGPGDPPTSFREHGFAFTYYSPQRRAPFPVSIILSPFFRLSESWLWGLFGGYLGKQFRRPSPAA